MFTQIHLGIRLLNVDELIYDETKLKYLWINPTLKLISRPTRVVELFQMSNTVVGFLHQNNSEERFPISVDLTSSKSDSTTHHHHDMERDRP